jgi:FMN phosphatase YigB (HAD superfamily)
MKKIKSIVIASDPLMTKETEQFSNRRWLKDLLFRPIRRATGIAPTTLASSRTLPEHINRTRFFELSGIEVNLDETQFWYDSAKITQASLDYLSEFVDSSTLVVGYELSRQTREVFSRMGIGYVDIWLHPVRFLDDILFGFNSNHDQVRERLFEFDLPEDQMYLYADRIRIQTYKGWRREEAEVKPNSALFVGQMMNDKSVCLDGRMLSVLDYKEQFEKIAATYSRVYYARHPYLRSGDEEIMRYLAGFENVEQTSVPTYRLLANQRINKVFGLSSSMIHEAKYFNKDHEFLFQPIVKYGDRTDLESFSTVLQEYISPHFWARILSPIMNTNECPRIGFLDPKDKVRDMLGFYWGYPEIDKVENMRRPPTVQKKAPAATKPPVIKKTRFKPADGFVQSRRDLEELCSKIDGHDVISFDVFDTLIERVVDEPSDVHHLMEPRVHSIAHGVFGDFPAERGRSRDLALSLANNEEVLLRERYRALASHHCLSETQANHLFELELSVEKDVCRSRFIGRVAFEHAVTQGKRIILVSDTYFDRSFMEGLLKDCGYAGWDKIYLSSEEGLLKHTGRLFERVLESEKRDPGTMLHVGDNPAADIQKAQERGLSTYHMPHKAEIVRKLSPLLEAYDAIQDKIARSLVKGLVARKLTSRHIECDAGFTHGDPSVFGYALLGPMFFGFAQWILKKAAEDQVTDLFFLARDGEIAKRCTDLLAAGRDNPPNTHYVLASRRSTRVAQLRSTEDVLALLEVNFTPCPVGDLLLKRFGIDRKAISEAVFRKHGFDGAYDMADWRHGKEQLVSLFSDPLLSKPILANAFAERDLLTRYYKQQGLVPSDGKRIAFVDIGHSGSLQASICGLMKIRESSGYYFATSDDIDQALKGGRHQSTGYVADRMKSTDQNHFYKRHILMFELVFQNAQSSFIRMREKGGAFDPEFIQCPREGTRIEFIKNAHDAVCDFVGDLVSDFGALVAGVSVDGVEVAAAYWEMLKAPRPVDAKLFRGIAFENVYSARDSRWIVPPKSCSSEMGLWLEGSEILRDDDDDRKKESTATRLIINMTARFVKNEKKRAKLYRDPEGFFRDSRHGVTRLIGKCGRLI